MKPVLQIDRLQVDYRTDRGPVPAVRGASLDVEPGEIVAIVGESGSGKSTLAHAVLGLLPGNGSISGGSITVGGHQVQGWSERRFRRIRGPVVALVPQDPGMSLNPVERIGTQVVEAVTAHRRLPRAQARTRGLELLERAGLEDAAQRWRQYPHELSGGLRQRVLIAIALASEPDLLIADEPTSALDVTVQRRILDHLESLSDETQMAILLVTHDLGVAADRADRVVVMHSGTVVEQGRTADILENPRQPYTQRLLASVPGLRAASQGATPASVWPRAAADRGAAWSAGDTEGEDLGQQPPLIEVTGLVKDFPLSRGRGGGTFRAVDEVSFGIPRGTTLGLVGESGSGKSTTARIVLGLTPASSGRVALDGVDITSAKGEAWRRLRRRLQVVYQNPYSSLDPRFTVSQVITEPLGAFGVASGAAARSRAADLLDRVALSGDLLDRYPRELSGGQRQRVAIARALALSPDLVVCDEAVSALDVSVQSQVIELLRSLQDEQGLSYLFITHDLAVVRDIAHQVVVMKQGAVVERGATETVFTAAQHEYTVELLGSIAGRRTADGRPGRGRGSRTESPADGATDSPVVQPEHDLVAAHGGAR